MENFNWESRIREWGRKHINTLEDYEKEKFLLEVIESSYLGYPGATEEQIAASEARLSVTFPRSYREFLKVSNGLCAAHSSCFYSVEEVDQYAVNEQDYIDRFKNKYRQDWKPIPDEEIYGEEQIPFCISPKHLQTALEISTYEANNLAIFLLNPQVVTSDGEWEAWYFDTKEGDAMRYRSFGEMMKEFLSNSEFFGWPQLPTALACTGSLPTTTG